MLLHIKNKKSIFLEKNNLVENVTDNFTLEFVLKLKKANLKLKTENITL